MTTATNDHIVVESWDYYLADDSPAREHVERYREMQWPHMQKELRSDLGYMLGVGQEPHWVESGRAVLFHRVIISDYGREKDFGWQATHPLPVGNAIQLLNYLRKGFRLRASVDPLVDVEMSETPNSLRVTIMRMHPTWYRQEGQTESLLTGMPIEIIVRHEVYL